MSPFSLLGPMPPNQPIAILENKLISRMMVDAPMIWPVPSRTVAASPEQFLARFVRRIDSLIANQDNLIASGWQGADLANLVRAQLAIFGDPIGTRITIEGPNLTLTPPAAQAIGMAIHELATNSSKHGALSVQSGSVDVGWCVDAENFTMTWLERGGPQVSPPTREGFGSKVLRALTELAVDGKVDLSYAP